MRIRHKTAPTETRFERIGSWTLAATAALTPLVYWPVARDANLAKPIVLAIALVVAGVAFASNAMRGERLRFRWTVLDWCVLIYFMVNCLSWTYSQFRYATIAAIRPILLCTLLYFAARAAMASEQARRRVVIGILAGSIVVSVLAVAEQFGQLPWGIQWKVSATWFNRTFLAAYLLMTLPIAVWAAWRGRAAGYAAIIAGVPALIFSGARIAWIALAPMLVAALVLGWPMVAARRRRIVVAVAGGSLAFLVIAQFGVARLYPRMAPTRLVSVAVARPLADKERMEVMTSAWRVGLDSPVLGRGAGAYAVYAPEKISPGFWQGILENQSVSARVVIVNAHNEVLEVFADLGIVGVIGLLAIPASAAFTARRGLANKETPAGDGWLLVALAAGVLGFLCANAVGISARVPGALAYYYLLLALIASMSRPVQDSGGAANLRPALAVLAAALGLLTAIGWGYASDLRASVYIVRGESLLNSASDISGAEAAVREFRRAVAITPNSPAAQYDLANALAVAGRHKEALRAYTDVEKLSPNFGRVHFNQGTSLYMLRRYREAEREMAQAYRLDHLPDSRYRLACLRKM